jgi:hypothetical protein
LTPRIATDAIGFLHRAPVPARALLKLQAFPVRPRLAAGVSPRHKEKRNDVAGAEAQWFSDTAR